MLYVLEHDSERRWYASIQHEGLKQHLGRFVEEAAAARAFDAAARRLRGDAAEGAVERKTSSAQRGVSRRKVKGKWEARIYIGGKRKRLGLFGDEAAAAAAYRRAAAERDAQ